MDITGVPTNICFNFQVREDNLTQIVMHQNVVAIEGVSLYHATGEPVALQFPDPFTTDSYYELLKINLAEPIPAGNYSVTVRFLGAINTNPVDRGFYRGYYYLNDQLRRVIHYIK